MESVTVEEVLEKVGMWTSTVEGSSMYPMLKDKQDVIVLEPKPEKINKYDVVLIRKNNKLVLHRIVKVYKNGYLFVGDNAYYKEIIKDEQIIAILTQFYKNGQTEPTLVTDKKYKRYAFFRVKTYYIRLFFYRLKLLFKRGKKVKK